MAVVAVTDDSCGVNKLNQLRRANTHSTAALPNNWPTTTTTTFRNLAGICMPLAPDVGRAAAGIQRRPGLYRRDRRRRRAGEPRGGHGRWAETGGAQKGSAVIMVGRKSKVWLVETLDTLLSLPIHPCVWQIAHLQTLLTLTLTQRKVKQINLSKKIVINVNKISKYHTVSQNYLKQHTSCWLSSHTLYFFGSVTPCREFWGLCREENWKFARESRQLGRLIWDDPHHVGLCVCCGLGERDGIGEQ